MRSPRPGRWQEPPPWSSTEGEYRADYASKVWDQRRAGKKLREESQARSQADSQESGVAPTLPPPEPSEPVYHRRYFEGRTDMGNMVLTQCRCRKATNITFCGFRYLKMQKCNLQGAVNQRGKPTSLTPHF